MTRKLSACCLVIAFSASGCGSDWNGLGIGGSNADGGTVSGRPDRDGGGGDVDGATQGYTIGTPAGLLLTQEGLDRMRGLAATGAPVWTKFQSHLDDNLTQLMNDSYQASVLTWVSDYALGYQVLKNGDPTKASAYADKALGILYSAAHDFQKASNITIKFLARGDGSTKTFTLSDPQVSSQHMRVFLGSVKEQAVTHAAAQMPDDVSYYQHFIQVSGTSGGAPSFTEGSDWKHNTEIENQKIDWAGAANEPPVGATYYVTMAAWTDAVPTSNYQFAGNVITLNTAPAADQAVYAEYTYGGTGTSDHSQLGYQQSHSDDGGFNSIFIDTTYPTRYLGKHVAMGLDWLDDYAGFPPDLRAECIRLLVKWSDFARDNAYLGDSPASNYGAGAYVSRMLAAVALKDRDPANATRLATEMTAYRASNVLPLLVGTSGPTLNGGFWAEGWNYGQLASSNLVIAGLAWENARLGLATEEHDWIEQVIDSLKQEQPTPDTIYDGGDYYSYPAPFPGSNLIQLLASNSRGTHAANARYMLSRPTQTRENDWMSLLYDGGDGDPAFWGDTEPLHYFAPGSGLTTARADWTYASTFVTFQLGSLLHCDHQTNTPGTVQIQRGADQLLINANSATEYKDAHIRSEYGNTVVVDDGGDGIQTYRWNTGNWYGTPGAFVDTHEEAAAYVYSGGDYTAAYSPPDKPGTGGPASKLQRQMVYVRPDFVFLHDRVATTKAAFAKQLRFHFLTNPTGDMTSVWAVTQGASKLFGRVFSTVGTTAVASPLQLESTTIYELIIAPQTATSSLRYTTVLESAPSSSGGMSQAAQVSSGDGVFEGAQLGAEVVLFGAAGKVSAGGASTYTFTGTSATHHVIVDLEPGHTYTAAGASVTASTAGVVAFDVAAGTSSVTIQ